MRVSQYMTPNPTTIHTDDNLRTAIDTMVQVGRRLPVVDSHGSLVGIITDRDLRLAVNSPLVPHSHEDNEKLLTQTRVSEIMSKDVITIGPTAWIDQAAAKMLDNHISGLPVMDKRNKLIGIITVSDLLRALIHVLEEKMLSE